MSSTVTAGGAVLATDRRRPAQLVSAAELLDDAPADGPSYPSGHAAVAACAAVLAAPHLPHLVLAALPPSTDPVTAGLVTAGAALDPASVTQGPDAGILAGCDASTTPWAAPGPCCAWRRPGTPG